MEYIDGVTLQEMLAKSGPLPVPLTLEVSRQALEALAKKPEERIASAEELAARLEQFDRAEHELDRLLELGKVDGDESLEGVGPRR